MGLRIVTSSSEIVGCTATVRSKSSFVAPIFTAQDDVCRGIALIGFTSQMNKDDLPALGEKVRGTAQAITQAVGGHYKFPIQAAE